MLNKKVINEKLDDLRALVREVNLELQDINDWGDRTGFCQEADRIGEDTISQIGSLLCRLSNLKRRIDCENAPDMGRAQDSDS